MDIIIARDILHWTEEQIWDLNEVKAVNLKLDDQSIKTTGRSIILSWYYWEIHRQYSIIPLVKSHLFNEDKYTTKSHLQFSGTIVWYAFDALRGEVEVYDLCELIYIATNKIYNGSIDYMAEYVTSTCILDYYDIVTDPYIVDKVKNTGRSQSELEDTKEEIKDYIMQPENFSDNALKALCDAAIPKWSQLLQEIAYRGYVTDVDNRFFNDPIMTGYAHGITKLGEAMQESRSGAKALDALEGPLQQTEYFNRRMQIILQIMTAVITGDCGTTQLLKIGVTKHNFNSLLGKYYVSKDGSYKVITKQSKELIGTRIEARSSVYCKHRSKYKICATCFGQLSQSVPPRSNIGQWCAVAFCNIISQLVLSTKHVDGAAMIEQLTMTTKLRKYFRLNDDGCLVFLNHIYDKNVIITVAPESVSHLEDLSIIDMINDYTAGRMSMIEDFAVTVCNPLPNYDSLSLGTGKNKAHFSKEVMEHIKEVGWTFSDKGFYQIDLTGMPKNTPILKLPKRHRNMLEFQTTVSKFIESTGSKDRKKKRTPEEMRDAAKDPKLLSDVSDPSAGLIKLLDLVNEKLEVNISHLEIFILSFMVTSVDDYNGMIPDIDGKPVFANVGDLFKLRSAGQAMSFQGHGAWFDDIRTFSGEGRPSHISDYLLTPEILNAVGIDSKTLESSASQS